MKKVLQMEGYLNQLCDILEQEIKIYNTILEKSKEKTDIVVSGRVNELDRIVKLEQSLVVQIGKLEQKREEVVLNIAGILNMDSNRLNIKQLIQSAPEEYQEKLEIYQKSLEDILGQLKDVNELNGKLIENALDYVEFSLNIMTNASISGNIYEKEGSTKNNISGVKNLFDVKL